MLNNKNKASIKNTGFSLIEIMVAIMILGTAFIGLVQAFPYALNIIKTAQNETRASYLAQTKMEEIFQMNYDDMSAGIIEAKHRLGAVGEDLYYFQRITEIELIDENFQPSAVDVGLKKASTTVFYINAFSKSESFYNLASVLVDK